MWFEATEDESQRHGFDVFPWMELTTINREVALGFAFRRSINGQWQDQSATQAERDKVEERNAW